MRTHDTCTSLNISKYYHQRSIMNAAIDLSTPAMSLWWYVNNSDMTAAVLALLRPIVVLSHPGDNPGYNLKVLSLEPMKHAVSVVIL